MRSCFHLQLLFLLLRPSYPNPTGFTFPCCPLCYSLPCRIYFRPFKKIFPSVKCFEITYPNTPFTSSTATSSWFLWSGIKILLVDLAGFAPASRILFSLLHTAILLYIITGFTKKSINCCPFRKNLDILAVL